MMRMTLLRPTVTKQKQNSGGWRRAAADATAKRDDERGVQHEDDSSAGSKRQQDDAGTAIEQKEQQRRWRVSPHTARHTTAATATRGRSASYARHIMCGDVYNEKSTTRTNRKTT
jgi:hypothetical protein